MIFGTIAATACDGMRAVPTIVASLSLLVFALPVRADDRVDEPREPNRDRVGLTPTAWTQPEGAWTFSSFDLFLERVSYAATGRLQIAVEALLVGAAGAAATVVVDDRGDTRLAVHLDTGVAGDPDQDDGVHPYFRGFVIHDGARAVGGSLIGGLCLGAECRSATTVVGRAGFTDVDSEAYVELSLAAASTYRVGNVHLLLQGELESCHANADCYRLVGTAGGGVRFAWSRVALDVGWAKRFRDKEPHTIVKGLTDFGSPWFSVTHRWL